MKKLATLSVLFIVLLGNTILAQSDTTKIYIKNFLVKNIISVRKKSCK